MYGKVDSFIQKRKIHYPPVSETDSLRPSVFVPLKLFLFLFEVPAPFVSLLLSPATTEALE